MELLPLPTSPPTRSWLDYFQTVPYSVWHERLALTSGRVVAAKIGLFDRLGLVPFAEQTKPHSVMIQPLTEFTVYLPPRRL